MTKRVACYIRVSTEEQNTALQEDALRSYCGIRGWHSPAPLFFVDHGESGAKASRPALDRMLDLVRVGELDVVLTWKFDRIGRSKAHLIDLLHEFKERNVDFISVVEAVDTTTPMGKMIFTILAGLAEFERDTLIMRTKAGLDAAKARGKVLGRPFRISEEERAVVKQRFLDGERPTDIAAEHKISRRHVYNIAKGTR